MGPTKNAVLRSVLTIQVVGISYIHRSGFLRDAILKVVTVDNDKACITQQILVTTVKMRKKGAITGKNMDFAKNHIQNTCKSIARNHADCVNLTCRV